jgi:hypothetical protein
MDNHPDRARIALSRGSDGVTRATAHVMPSAAERITRENLGKIKNFLVNNPDLFYRISEDEFDVDREFEGSHSRSFTDQVLKAFSITVEFNSAISTETQVKIVMALRHALVPYVNGVCIDLTGIDQPTLH